MRAKKGMYESAQAAPEGLMTEVKGGKAPSKHDVIESANARAQKRHDTGGDEVADVRTLPAVSGESLDRAGIVNNGYLTKKGLDYGVTAFYNTLPPGMNIEDQENADIRVEPYKEVTNKSYPGDNPWGRS